MTVAIAIGFPVLVAGAIVFLVLAIREGNKTHAASIESETSK